MRDTDDRAEAPYEWRVHALGRGSSCGVRRRADEHALTACSGAHTTHVRTSSARGIAPAGPSTCVVRTVAIVESLHQSRVPHLCLRCSVVAANTLARGLQ